MTYWPAYVGDQLEAGLGFLDWLWDTREACRAWTRQFFGLDGLNVPMTADILNRQIGGWRQYTHSVSTSAWLSHHFHQHWRYSQDRAFLADRAYPYLGDVCRFVEGIS
jgi:alpha-L-fucosidase 2